MMVWRLPSFSDGLFPGAMLNFQRLSYLYTHSSQQKAMRIYDYTWYIHVVLCFLPRKNDILVGGWSTQLKHMLVPLDHLQQRIKCHHLQPIQIDLTWFSSWRSPTTFKTITCNHSKKGHLCRIARLVFYATIHPLSAKRRATYHHKSGRSERHQPNVLASPCLIS